jgi:general nucleoside transport system permease protein
VTKVGGAGLGDSLRAAVPSLIALLLGLGAASVLMWALGLNPLNVFTTLFKGALYTQFGQSSVLTYMGSYILLALAFIVPGKAGIWNVGGQGQAILGGISAAIFIVFVPLPIVLWPLAAVLVACAVGGLWAAICGILEAYRNASAIVTTIMLNFVAASFASFLLLWVVVRKVPSAAQNNYVVFKSAATIPGIPYLNTSIMFIVAIVVAVGVAYFLQRTTTGYAIRATGLGSRPAESKGINPKSTKVIAMVIGGVLAGLAGAGDVMSVGHGCYLVACYQEGFAGGWFGGEGFAGIAVALVAANNPIGSVFSAIFFAILASGTASVGQDIYVVWAMQGIIILFMAAPHLSKSIMKLGGKKKWT